VVAYGFLFLGFLIKALLMLSPVSYIIPHSYYSLHYSFIFEMIFLSFALSDRVRILKSNRDKALRRTIQQQDENMRLKDKVNRELEEKVRTRTKEIAEKNALLEVTNQKIIKQSEEIGAINSLLDLDNWKLRNNIREIQRERLMNKHLSYEEFNGIFRNNHDCLRYLSDYKWTDKDTFECHKCLNQKYFKGQGVLARRCTRCGYNETASSHTIFHACKFPLEKAFYILYSVLSRDETSLDSLSAKLEIRKNTVWNFKKKINKQLETENDTLYLFFDNLEKSRLKVRPNS